MKCLAEPKHKVIQLFSRVRNANLLKTDLYICQENSPPSFQLFGAGKYFCFFVSMAEGNFQTEEEMEVLTGEDCVLGCRAEVNDGSE